LGALMLTFLIHSPIRMLAQQMRGP